MRKKSGEEYNASKQRVLYERIDPELKAHNFTIRVGPSWMSIHQSFRFKKRPFFALILMFFGSKGVYKKKAFEIIHRLPFILTTVGMATCCPCPEGTKENLIILDIFLY